jgi:hypothetical protein
MTRPQFNTTVSLGNVLQIGAMLVALGLGWAVMDARGQDNAERVAENRVTLTALEGRVRALESGSARLDERLRSMEGILNRIDERLANMERQP